MPPIIGNIIVIAILLVVLYVCGKNVIQDIKGELTGKGCAGCSGNCSGSCSSCGSNCSSKIKTEKKTH
ncbi:MAG: FeoB-associated Cys-rich membrane protein [Butyrivibrio sp.]|nr:FeoB-associated Cys-rich membrane protein [Butyrivibrio sp.]